MKTYVFEIKIQEGSDEFWEEIEASRKTGCDEVTEVVQEMLDGTGFQDAKVTLKQFYDIE